MVFLGIDDAAVADLEAVVPHGVADLVNDAGDLEAGHEGSVADPLESGAATPTSLQLPLSVVSTSEMYLENGERKHYRQTI